MESTLLKIVVIIFTIFSGCGGIATIIDVISKYQDRSAKRKGRKPKKRRQAVGFVKGGIFGLFIISLVLFFISHFFEGGFYIVGTTIVFVYLLPKETLSLIMGLIISLLIFSCFGIYKFIKFIRTIK